MKKRQNKLYFRELGGIIRNFRNRMGLSIEKAAYKAGISADHWKKIEASRRFPSIRNLESICKVINTEIDEILEEAVNFRNYISSIVDKNLVTLVIVKDGVQEPWQVSPYEAGKLPDQKKLSAEKQSMIDLGWINGEEKVIARLSNKDEIEAWKNHVSDSISAGIMNVDGEGLSEILETSYWVSPRFHEIENAKTDFIDQKYSEPK